MDGRFADVAIANAEYMLERGIPKLANAKLTELEELLQLCTLFRQRGTCTLLREGTAERFHLDNMQSAGAFAHLLPDLDETEKVCSWAKPLWDCVVSEYWDAARHIAQHSRATWNRDREYEDDFCYVRFVVRFLLLGEPLEQAEALLERWEQALEGGADPRLDICRAMLTQEPDEFDVGLRTLMNERGERAWGMVEREVITNDPAIWYPHVSVEGLSLLTLARRVVGLETDRNYPACPEAAMGPSPFVFDPQAWRSLHYRGRRAP